MANRILRTGIIGTVITALCCFTPLLVLMLGTLGLSALSGYLDLVLLPLLGLFLVMAGVGLWRHKQRA